MTLDDQAALASVMSLQPPARRKSRRRRQGFFSFKHPETALHVIRNLIAVTRG